MTNKPIVVEQTFDASPAAVWKAITDKDQMIKWYFEQIEAFEPRVGFRTQFNVHHEGKNYLHLWKVTEVQPFKRIVYEWKYPDYPGDSHVVWEITKEDIRTRLTLSCFGIETFPQDNPDFSRESCMAGWTYFIKERLKEFLAQHRDL